MPWLTVVSCAKAHLRFCGPEMARAPRSAWHWVLPLEGQAEESMRKPLYIYTHTHTHTYTCNGVLHSHKKE